MNLLYSLTAFVARLKLRSINYMSRMLYFCFQNNYVELSTEENTSKILKHANRQKPPLVCLSAILNERYVTG